MITNSIEEKATEIMATLYYNNKGFEIDSQFQYSCDKLLKDTFFTKRDLVIFNVILANFIYGKIDMEKGLGQNLLLFVHTGDKAFLKEFYNPKEVEEIAKVYNMLLYVAINN